MRTTHPVPAPPGRRVRGALATAAVAAALVVVPAAAPAQAHDALRSTDPADGAALAVAPDAVVLTFDRPALALGTEVVVTAPDGRDVAAGEPELVDETVRQRLAGTLPAGSYTVDWRVTSADGHPVDGTFAFTTAGEVVVGDEVVAPGGPATTEPATTEPAPPTPTGGPAAADPGPTPTPEASADRTPDPTAPATEAAPAPSSAGGGAGGVLAAVAGAVVVAAVVAALLARRRRG